MIPKVKLRKRTQKSFKRLLTTMSILRLVFGIYTNISSSKFICCILKMYSIATCIFILLTWCTSNLYYDLAIIFISVMIEYVCVIIINLFRGDNYLRSFVNDVIARDKILGLKNTPVLSNSLTSTIVLISALRLVTIILRSCMGASSWIVFFDISFVLIVIDLNILSIFIVFGILQNRLRILKMLLQSNSVSVNITRSDHVTVAIRNVKKILYYYKSWQHLPR